MFPSDSVEVFHHMQKLSSSINHMATEWTNYLNHGKVKRSESANCAFSSARFSP